MVNKTHPALLCFSERPLELFHELFVFFWGGTKENSLGNQGEVLCASSGFFFCVCDACVWKRDGVGGVHLRRVILSFNVFYCLELIIKMFEIIKIRILWCVQIGSESGGGQMSQNDDNHCVLKKEIITIWS